MRVLPMTRRTLGWIGAFAVATVLAMVTVPPGGTAFTTDVHEPLPDFTLTDIDGNVLTPALLRGKVTIVNFWATWCGPCLVEVPQFVALQAAHPDELQIIGVSLDESIDEVRLFATEHGINYAVALAPAGFDGLFGGVAGIPTSFVVDPDGHIVNRHLGLVADEVYEEEIHRLMGSTSVHAARASGPAHPHAHP